MANNFPTAVHLPLGVREVTSSGEESREEAAAEAEVEAEEEDLERGNKRTILRRICEQLGALTGKQKAPWRLLCGSFDVSISE